MTKIRKTEAELKAIAMAELRKDARCSMITGVAITKPVQAHSDAPNWGLAFVCNGNPSAPAVAYEIETKLQNQFEMEA